MNRELLETQWQQLREAVKERWSNLTDEEIRQINGRYDQLVTKLQQKYGYTREEAEEELRNWNAKPGMRFERETRFEREPRFEAEKEGRAYKERVPERSGMGIGSWLLLAAIPLLLLAGYLANRDMETPTNTTPTVTSQPLNTAPTVVSQPSDINAQNPNFTGITANDRIISQSISSALMADRALFSDARNVNIETSNGEVTITGSVATSQQKDLITRIAEGFSGVTGVNNEVTVR